MTRACWLKSRHRPERPGSAHNTLRAGWHLDRLVETAERGEWGGLWW